jgi:hypothetical protein
MNTAASYKWTPRLAYAVGLITTDGCLSKDKRHIDFTSADRQLVETLKNCLSLKNRIGAKSNGQNTQKEYYHVQFSNTEFYDWLTSIGVTMKKSRNLKIVKVPRKYMRDFLRGHLDGDGSIFTYADNYMRYKGKRYTYQRLYTAFNSTSHDHILWIQNSLAAELHIKGALNSWLRRNRRISLWTLRFAKNDSLKLLKWLYYKPSLPCLNRKKEIADKFIKSQACNN